MLKRTSNAIILVKGILRNATDLYLHKLRIIVTIKLLNANILVYVILPAQQNQYLFAITIVLPF